MRFALVLLALSTTASATVSTPMDWTAAVRASVDGGPVTATQATGSPQDLPSCQAASAVFALYQAVKGGQASSGQVEGLRNAALHAYDVLSVGMGQRPPATPDCNNLNVTKCDDVLVQAFLNKDQASFTFAKDLPPGQAKPDWTEGLTDLQKAELRSPCHVQVTAQMAIASPVPPGVPSAAVGVSGGASDPGNVGAAK